MNYRNYTVPRRIHTIGMNCLLTFLEKKKLLVETSIIFSRSNNEKSRSTLLITLLKWQNINSYLLVLLTLSDVFHNLHIKIRLQRFTKIIYTYKWTICVFKNLCNILYTSRTIKMKLRSHLCFQYNWIHRFLQAYTKTDYNLCCNFLKRP